MAKKSNDQVIEKARERGEPLFTLRAQDVHSVDTLEFYRDQCVNAEHKDGVDEAIEEFKTWQVANQGSVKEPD